MKMKYKLQSIDKQHKRSRLFTVPEPVQRLGIHIYEAPMDKSTRTTHSHAHAQRNQPFRVSKIR